MNALQKALTKFGRRYTGAGRDSFSLSRPTEPSYGGQQVIKDPTIGRGRAANRAPNAQEMFRERDAAVAGNPLGGVGAALSNVFGSGNPSDDIQTQDAVISNQITTRPLEKMPEFGGGPSVEKKSVADKLRDEIRRREGKDFSKGGADYDKDHDWKDALRGAGLGALQALSKADPNLPLEKQLGMALGGAMGGGVSGAFDRNTDEKLANEMVLERDYPKWARAFESESAVTNQRLGEADKIGRIQDRETDNARMEADLERKVRRDSVLEQRDMAAIEKGRAQVISNERLLELREKTAASNDANAKRRLELIEKEMENRNLRSEADRTSREKIAGMKEGGLNRRQQISIEADKLADAIADAERMKRVQEAGKLREQLEKLKNEYDQLP